MLLSKPTIVIRRLFSGSSRQSSQSNMYRTTGFIATLVPAKTRT